MTERELLVLQDQLSNEELLIKKFRSYANESSDPEIKDECNRIAQKHMNHFNMLMKHINSAAMQGQYGQGYIPQRMY